MRAKLAQGECGEATAAFRVLGEGQGDLPALMQVNSKCRTAARSVASARSESAPVIFSSGQSPPISATAMASAACRLARRSAAPSSRRERPGGNSRTLCSSAATCASGPEAMQASSAAEVEAGEFRQIRGIAAQRVEQRDTVPARGKEAFGFAQIRKIRTQPGGGLGIRRFWEQQLVGAAGHLASRTG